MSLAEAILSGVLQGITEFLPISSSGHLVLLHRYLNLAEPGIFFDICLHAGTLAAIIVYFSKDLFLIIRERNMLWVRGIAVGSIPAVVAVLFFEKTITSFFMDPRKVGCMFIVTAFVLFAAQFSLRKENEKRKDLGRWDPLLVGISQALALLPGISRSGATISTGLVRGMRKETAFKFSFLLAVPAIITAVIYKGLERSGGGGALIEDPLNYIAGTAAAFIIGLISLPVLLKVIKAKRLYIFGLYCLFLGISGIFFWK